MQYIIHLSFLINNYTFFQFIGSTITGIHHLEKHGLRSALIDAIEAATLRCKEVSLQTKED